MSAPEPPVANLISVAEAIAVIDAEPVWPRAVTAALSAAVGRRLAVDVLADRDYPPFDKAVMDGFALTAPPAAGDELVVAGTIHAGHAAGAAIKPGTAAAVMTGAPVPPGTALVIPVEFTTRVGDRIRIDRPAAAGQAIARRGSDAPHGRLLIPAGTMIGPPQAAVIASVGLAFVEVFDRPRVAVFSTGDELIPIGQTPVGPQIRNSNSAMLTSLLESLRCEVRDLGIVRDDPAAVRAALEKSADFDALFVTGGMSMGEKDYVPPLLKEIGFTSKIAKLRIKPGKPFVFAVNGNAKVFGLPGNPVSAYVCTLGLAARLLRRMAGGPAGNDLLRLKLTAPLPANGPREFYLPAARAGTDTTPLNPNGSADVFTLAAADVLIIRPENAPPAATGDETDCLPLMG